MLYLPRLYVYHAMCDDEIGNDRFKVMERKLYYGIMTPGAMLTVIFGTWLWLGYGFGGSWLMWKLISGFVTYCLSRLVWFDVTHLSQ